jgi:sterol desaturase/sphingolipid hydroxylase (fatty acid hydroxylase superfamily)
VFFAATFSLPAQATDLTRVAVSILTTDFLRYAVTASAVYLVLWKLLPAGVRRSRQIFDDGIKPGQMRRELAYSMLTVLIFAATGFGIFLLKQAGYTQLYADLSKFGWLYWVLSVALAIVLQDAYFYWTHRLLHQRWWFRHVHRVHHLSTHPTPWAAYAFHPAEALMHAAFFVLLVVTIPLHHAAAFAFLAHMIVRNCIGHSGFEVLPWRLATRGWLRWLTTVTHHHFHHARNGGNYGLYFTWWDRLCGTEDAAHRTHGDMRFGLVAPKGPR